MVKPAPAASRVVSGDEEGGGENKCKRKRLAIARRQRQAKEACWRLGVAWVGARRHAHGRMRRCQAHSLRRRLEDGTH